MAPRVRFRVLGERVPLAIGSEGVPVRIGAGWQMAYMTGVLALVAPIVAAQGASAPEVPSAYVPPPGMCRVWLREVPPVQQPAPTDCRSAVRTKPVGATVVYGPEAKRPAYTPNDWTRPVLKSTRDDDRFRSSAACIDLNRDGACEQTSEACTDGVRCDEALPTMRSAVLWTEGQRPPDLQRWFGSQNVAARFSMPSRGASPDRVQWFDVDGRLVQTWIDRNGDGRADRVEIFNRDGARIRVIGQ
jgi:hypothetical protein